MYRRAVNTDAATESLVVTPEGDVKQEWAEQRIELLVGGAGQRHGHALLVLLVQRRVGVEQVRLEVFVDAVLNRETTRTLCKQSKHGRRIAAQC